MAVVPMNAAPSQTEALRRVLAETLELLQSVHETFWSSRIRSVLDELDPREVLSWYGGMGSFNDLLIARVNGHQVPPGGEQSMNDALDRLRRRAYDLAKDA
jgi:hypothetical protein